MKFISINGGVMTITDKTNPDIIASTFSCSKKDFKKAIGALYKQKKIIIGDDKITIA